MWELRLILILIGAAIVAGVYLFSRQKTASQKMQKRAPTLNDLDFDDADLPSDELSPGSLEEAPIRNEGEQLILALHVMPRSSGFFSGSDVIRTLDSADLKFGRFQVFHRLQDRTDPGSSVFSVANMVEPGSFDLAALPQAALPGLTLFMVLPGPRGGVASYADMLATARRLALDLEGEVLDETRSTLTRQTARHIRERIIQFEHQNRTHSLSD